MSILGPKYDARATAVKVEGQRLVVDLADGRSIAVPLVWHPRLTHASSSQLANWRLIGSGEGIHWPELDEDLSVEGLLRGVSDETSRPLVYGLPGSDDAGDALVSKGATAAPESVARLRADAIRALQQNVGHVESLPGARSIYIVDHTRLNLRTASRKNAEAFWFDVTPAYYELNIVDFFMYVCGRVERSFVFSRDEMKMLAKNAHRGGSKNVPNFTIHADTFEFEPAGAGGRRIRINDNLNAFQVIKRFQQVR